MGKKKRAGHGSRTSSPRCPSFTGDDGGRHRQSIPHVRTSPCRLILGKEGNRPRSAGRFDARGYWFLAARYPFPRSFVPSFVRSFVRSFCRSFRLCPRQTRELARSSTRRRLSVNRRARLQRPHEFQRRFRGRPASGSDEGKVPGLGSSLFFFPHITVKGISSGRWNRSFRDQNCYEGDSGA